MTQKKKTTKKQPSKNSEYQRCTKCHKAIRELPFTCKYCHKHFCGNCHLPEDHNCQSMKKHHQSSTKWMNVDKPTVFEDNSRVYIGGGNFLPENEIRERTRSKMPRRRRHKKKNFLQRNLGVIVAIVLFLSALAYFGGGNSLPFVKTCEDGTRYEACSTDSPLMCINGSLEERASICGCDRGFEVSGDTCAPLTRCSDGSYDKECSYNKPDYCDGGTLIKKASKCGCDFDEIKSGEECISKYQTEPKTVRLDGVGRFTVYGGLNDYLSGLTRTISYYEGEAEPTTKDFILRSLNNPEQKEFLDELVLLIQEESSNKRTQVRIAVDLVQGIPYDDDLADTLSINPFYGKERYPYEVLYDNKGVCGEKSLLLAYILRELGFGVAIFEFEAESHRAVGILCDDGDYDSNYCFIESTDDYAIGRIPSDYVGGADIRGATPEIIVISGGEEY